MFNFVSRAGASPCMRSSAAYVLVLSKLCPGARNASSVRDVANPSRAAMLMSSSSNREQLSFLQKLSAALGKTKSCQLSVKEWILGRHVQTIALARCPLAVRYEHQPAVRTSGRRPPRIVAVPTCRLSARPPRVDAARSPPARCFCGGRPRARREWTSPAVARRVLLLLIIAVGARYAGYALHNRHVVHFLLTWGFRLFPQVRNLRRRCTTCHLCDVSQTNRAGSSRTRAPAAPSRWSSEACYRCRWRARSAGARTCRRTTG